MYGLDNNIDEFKENDFLNLEVEIIFVFSHGYTVKSYIEKEKSTVASLLKKSIDSQSFFRVGRTYNFRIECVTIIEKSVVVSIYISIFF